MIKEVRSSDNGFAFSVNKAENINHPEHPVFTDCYLNTDSKCKPKYTLLIIVGAMLFEQIFFLSLLMEILLAKGN
jgi:hypothetical protein